MTTHATILKKLPRCVPEVCFCLYMHTFLAHSYQARFTGRHDRKVPVSSAMLNHIER